MSQIAMPLDAGTRPARLVEPGYERVAEAFATGQATDEGGAQLCVYRDGRAVVDVWAGRDKVRDRPFDDRTIAGLMSCAKAGVAVCALMLAERGLLELDAPVAAYWPEFAQNGKADITVRQILSHSAGLMGFEPESGISPSELFDWDRSVAAIEAMAPLWAPGAAYAYHFFTYGLLVGEVIRRVSGKTVGRFFADEVAAPLGLDMWIGLPEAEEARFAPHFQVAPSLTPDQWRRFFAGAGVDVESRLMRAVVHTFSAIGPAVALISEDRRARAVELPAANGIGNARSLARMYAALIGEVDGVRLIGPESLEDARAEQTAGLSCPAALAPLIARSGRQGFGLGFELAGEAKPMLGEGCFGHSGAGGRIAFASPERGVAVGYVCNAMINSTGNDPRWIPWINALSEALES
jgi:CubicO group peptidase (beta-lactamase class C family)